MGENVWFGEGITVQFSWFNDDFPCFVDGKDIVMIIIIIIIIIVVVVVGCFGWFVCEINVVNWLCWHWCGLGLAHIIVIFF